MNEKELYKFWKKNINIPIYRVVPSCDLKNIKKNGINPEADPYKGIEKEVKILLKIVNKLEKEGNDLHLFWGTKKVSFSYSLKVTLADFDIACIDFTPKKDDIDYYLGYKGGAATHNLRQILEILEKYKINLAKKDEKAIKNIKNFVDKRLCENKVLAFNGNSKIFEKSLFQKKRISKNKKKIIFTEHRYLKSPFGSFEHFKKFYNNNDLRPYIPYLKSKMFYLRVKEKIPSKEIKLLK